MINNVGIVGAGQMGSGIAHVVSLSGRKVQLLDLDQDLLRRSIETIEKNMARQASRGKSYRRGCEVRALTYRNWNRLLRL